MTHINPMPDSAGDFSEAKKSEGKCPNCEQQTITYQLWESHCGGYEDYHYTCSACKYSWWVDGIDS